MAGEKSHAPTPRRRQRARQQGQGWFSPDFQAAFGLLVAFLGLRWYLPWAGRHLAEYSAAVWSTPPGGGFALGLTAVSVLSLKTLAIVLWPFALPLGALGMLVGMGQTGGRFALSRLAPDFRRLNPVTGLARMFSREGLWLLVKGLLKLLVIGMAAGSVVAGQIRVYPQLVAMSLGSALHEGVTLLTAVLWRAAAAFFLIGVVDLGYQVARYQRSLKMTTDELRDEQKEMEGDPRMRARRREQARRLARTGLKEIKNAQVVITNPTHLAVALKWDERVMVAPEVVAKGEDHVALEMRRIAYDHSVPVVENPPLARSLYLVPLGRPIPEQHYQAVADILAFILRRRPGGFER